MQKIICENCSNVSPQQQYHQCCKHKEANKLLNNISKSCTILTREKTIILGETIHELSVSWLGAGTFVRKWKNSAVDRRNCRHERRTYISNAMGNVCIGLMSLNLHQEQITCTLTSHTKVYKCCINLNEVSNWTTIPNELTHLNAAKILMHWW